MKTSDFDYYLPPDRIAQTPVEPRHSSRLLVLDRKTSTVEDNIFYNIDRFLNPGDLLVINQTKVIPARLYAHKSTTGGRVEVLLLTRQDDHTWEALLGGKRMIQGQRLKIVNGPGAEIIAVLDGSRRLVRFDEPIENELNWAGNIPLPPYIHTPLSNPERYQTVYAEQSGSVAAPTAGLHFTPELMSRLESKGVKFARLTLHVGLDTFAPVTEADPETHVIHTEWCELPPQSADVINQTRRTGGRIIAVGTTSVRTLESASVVTNNGDVVHSFSGPTGLFILPGFQFQVVDALITNFHLPKSTLLMLVSAFAGRETILNTYQQAVEMNYRFYSFGDAMFIL